jgi:hypothetical protein
VLDVMREKWRKWDWVALMIDVEPADFLAGICVPHQERWLRIKGKYQNRDAACEALNKMMATRQ